jgi:hypothetical protein
VVVALTVQAYQVLGINREDIELLSHTVLRLGGYAEGLFDFHDFGFEKSILRQHVSNVYEMLLHMKERSTSFGLPLRPPNLPPSAFWEDQGETWNYLQTLRFAAGSIMMSEDYRQYMTPDNLYNAMTAKVLHKCMIGILDDLIDKGNYSYLEAKDLHHTVLSSMVDPDFDETVYVKRLISMLKQEHVPLFDLMNSITKGFNALWNHSPHGTDYFYQMEVLDERVALGQALTMFQKEPNFSISKMHKVASAFYEPQGDMTWWEKLGAHVSATVRYNFIDMAFADRVYDLKKLESFLAGWYYYDTAIILMDHVTSIHQDLRNGIGNLSLIAMRTKELESASSLRAYNPALTVEDYDGHLRRIASLTSKALELVDHDLHDENLFYPFLTIMMPVVMMADWIGKRDDMIHTFLDAIAPAIRHVSAITADLPEIASTREPA